MRAGCEKSWLVNGLRLRGLTWGRPEQPPLLMLHGWLDNAASFSLLAPLLEDFHVVALDLTGHGRSDRRSDDATYHIWDDLPEVFGVVEQLGWEQFDVIGHSRGAIIASLMASAFPERIGRLVLLDAIFPQAVAESEFPAQMRKFLNQKPALLEAQNRVFSSVSEAVAARSKGGLDGVAASLLVERGIEPCEDGVTWTTDRRLHGASAVKLTPGQNHAVLKNLSMPALLLLAEGGGMASLEDLHETIGHSPGLVTEYVPGGHHFHMEQPLGPLAARIDKFLQEDTA